MHDTITQIQTGNQCKYSVFRFFQNRFRYLDNRQITILIMWFLVERKIGAGHDLSIFHLLSLKQFKNKPKH